MWWSAFYHCAVRMKQGPPVRTAEHQRERRPALGQFDMLQDPAALRPKLVIAKLRQSHTLSRTQTQYPSRLEPARHTIDRECHGRGLIEIFLRRGVIDLDH